MSPGATQNSSPQRDQIRTLDLSLVWNSVFATPESRLPPSSLGKRIRRKRTITRLCPRDHCFTDRRNRQNCLTPQRNCNASALPRPKSRARKASIRTALMDRLSARLRHRMVLRQRISMWMKTEKPKRRSLFRQPSRERSIGISK